MNIMYIMTIMYIISILTHIILWIYMTFLEYIMTSHHVIGWVPKTWSSQTKYVTTYGLGGQSPGPTLKSRGLSSFPNLPYANCIQIVIKLGETRTSEQTHGGWWYLPIRYYYYDYYYYDYYYLSLLLLVVVVVVVVLLHVVIIYIYNYVIIWLVVYQPLWKIWKSVGMMKFPTEWKVIINFMFQSPPTSNMLYLDLRSSRFPSHGGVLHGLTRGKLNIICSSLQVTTHLNIHSWWF